MFCFSGVFFRSDDYEPDALRVGVTRNMLDRWRTQTGIEGATGAVPLASTGGKPAWQLELEMTPTGSGVFENQPMRRDDVIREDDREPDMIPVRQMRRTRALWNRREREEMEGQRRMQPQDNRAKEVNLASKAN